MRSSAYYYDQANRLDSILEDGNKYSFKYNPRFQRYRKEFGPSSSDFVYSMDGQLLTEYQSSDWECDYVYLYGVPIVRLWAENRTDTLPQEPEWLIGGLLGDSLGGGGLELILPPGGGTTTTFYNISYYHTDHLGTPLAMTSQNRNLRWEAKYYPFGDLNTEVVSKPNNLRFPGQYHDREGEPDRELYYSWFRYYQPQLGRFITSDPIGLSGGINLYSYAGQNPVNYTDPMGLYSWGEFWQDAQIVNSVIDPLSLVMDELGAAVAPYLPEGLRRGTWFGTVFGEQAVDYWAARYNATNSPLDWTAGAFASLWTEDTWFGTASAMACAAGPLLSVPKGTHSVYMGLDEFGATRYVGATGRVPKIRFAEHRRAYGTGRESLRYYVLDEATGLTKIDARILEQQLINRYGLGPKGGQLLNKINSISPIYWRLLGIR